MIQLCPCELAHYLELPQLWPMTMTSYSWALGPLQCCWRYQKIMPVLCKINVSLTPCWQMLQIAIQWNVLVMNMDVQKINEKKETEISMTSNFWKKNPSRPAYSCTRCARCARCTLRLNFCLALATKIEGEVQNPTRTLQFESSIQVQGNQFWGRHVSLRKNTHVFAENLKTVPGSIYVSYRVIWNVPACCSKTSDLDFLQAAVMLQWFFRFLLDKMKIVHRCRKL